MNNEFVIRDPSKLAEAATTVQVTDHMLKVLSETSQRIGAGQPDLADAFDAIADVIQAVVMKHVGVDVRRVGAPPTDEETAEIALRAIQVNLGCEDKADNSEPNWRSRQQLIATSLHVYREQLNSANSDEASKTLDRTLRIVDSISDEFGYSASSSSLPFYSKSIVLVEHDREEREMLQQALADQDFDVHAFIDDASALQFVFDKPCSATVLLNVQHAKTGRNSIQQIRKHPVSASIRVIGMSNMPFDDLEMPLAYDGFDQWFRKPFRVAMLLDALKTTAINSRAA